MLNNKEFGALIATRRREIGLTQDAFAVMLGITPQAVSKWENGVGYPDVTLFPHIAHALNISLDALFGTESDVESNTTDTPAEASPEKKAPAVIPGVPTKFSSLPLVAAGEQYLCYSNKAVSRVCPEEARVEFADGSTASLDSGEVINRGTGEIRMLPMENVATSQEQAEDDTPRVRQESFLYFHSIQLLCRGCGKIIVKTSPDEQGHMEVSGPSDFLRSVSASVKGETLTLDLSPLENNGNGDTRGKQIVVWIPVASGGQLTTHITGCCEVQCEPSFSHAAIHISGCGELHGSRTQTLTAAISGCGEIHWGAAEENTSITVSGCGTVAVDYAANPHVSINGSGDVTLRRVSGSMSATIGGSGEITAAGELDSFTCHLDGAGSVCGEQLSVSEAGIVINSTGTVHLGRIRSHSKEKLGQAATLTVDHRGNPVGGTANLPLK